jgi:hypothetical protein
LVGLRVQGSGRGADGDGLAGTDLTGDHTQGVLVDAPGDAGHRLGVSAMAVQHRGGQPMTERHDRKTKESLQPLDAHRLACRGCSSSVRSVSEDCSGLGFGIVLGVGVERVEADAVVGGDLLVVGVGDQVQVGVRIKIRRKPATDCVDAGCQGWFVLVMGGTPLSVRVCRATAPESLIYCQQISDQPVCI